MTDLPESWKQADPRTAAQRLLPNERPVAEQGWSLERGKYTYPPLIPIEKVILKILAKNLFVSQHSLFWAYYLADADGGERLHKLARKMKLTPKLTVVEGDGDAEKSDL